MDEPGYEYRIYFPDLTKYDLNIIYSQREQRKQN